MKATTVCIIVLCAVAGIVIGAHLQGDRGVSDETNEHADVVVEATTTQAATQEAPAPTAPPRIEESMPSDIGIDATGEMIME